MKPAALLTACLALSFIGCDDKPSAPSASAPPPTAAPDKSRPSDAAIAEMLAIKPEYEIAIEESKTEPKQYAVTWSAKVNTGGWTMKTDTVLVEEYNGAMACRIWVTLEQPGPGDAVTQAVETLTGKHDAGAKKIERVEFSARRHIRGVDFGGPVAYSVEKSIRYPWWEQKTGT